MDNMGVEVVTTTPEQFQKKLRDEAAHWSKVVRQYGIQGE